MSDPTKTPAPVAPEGEGEDPSRNYGLWKLGEQASASEPPSAPVVSSIPDQAEISAASYVRPAVIVPPYHPPAARRAERPHVHAPPLLTPAPSSGQAPTPFLPAKGGRP